MKNSRLIVEILSLKRELIWPYKNSSFHTVPKGNGVLNQDAKSLKRTKTANMVHTNNEPVIR